MQAGSSRGGPFPIYGSTTRAIKRLHVVLYWIVIIIAHHRLGWAVRCGWPPGGGGGASRVCPCRSQEPTPAQVEAWREPASSSAPAGRATSGLVGTGEPHRVLGPPIRHAHAPSVLRCLDRSREPCLCPAPAHRCLTRGSVSCLLTNRRFN
jgi:hypothetical protein